MRMIGLALVPAWFISNVYDLIQRMHKVKAFLNLLSWFRLLRRHLIFLKLIYGPMHLTVFIAAHTLKITAVTTKRQT